MPETTQLLPRTPPAPNADTHGGLIGSWLASYPSPNTRASYRVDARLFCEFLDAGRVDLLQVSRAHVDASGYEAMYARQRFAAKHTPVDAGSHTS